MPVRIGITHCKQGGTGSSDRFCPPVQGDVLLLSRIQFALTSGFHYLYPPLSIGLGLGLVIMEGLWLKNRNPLCHPMARFWDWKLGQPRHTTCRGPAAFGEPHI